MDEINKLYTIIEILKKLGWVQISEKEKYIVLKPPKELNFSNNYSLFIPTIVNNYNNYDNTNEIIKTIASIYKVDAINIELLVEHYDSNFEKEDLLEKINNYLKIKFYKNELGILGTIYLIMAYTIHETKYKCDYFLIISLPDNTFIKAGKVISFGADVVSFYSKKPYKVAFEVGLQHAKEHINYIYHKTILPKNHAFWELEEYTKIGELKEISPSHILYIVSKDKNLKNYILKNTNSEELKTLLNNTSMFLVEEMPFDE